MSIHQEPSFKKAGQKLTNHAKNALVKAELIAKKFEYPEILNAHLLYAVFLEKGSMGGNIMADLGITEEKFHKLMKENSPRIKTESGKKITTSKNLKSNFIKAYNIAKDFNYPYVGTEHLTYAIIESRDPIIGQIIAETESNDIQSLKSLFDPSQLSNLPKIFDIPEITLGKPKNDKKNSTTPFLDKFCININEETRRKNEIIIGREKEIERAINILGRKNKNNPLLIGDPGIGKTALVSGLAQLINSGNVPSSLFKKKILNLDIAQLIAGTSFRGEFESRLKEIIKEVSANKDVLLFIDEIHNIVGAGNVSGSLDLANIIKPALARGEMQLIGATTTEEYKKYIEKDAALERRFQPVNMQESTPEETRKILLGIRKNYEAFHNVSISNAAIDLTIELGVRYIQNRFLPDKAIDIIDEAASNIRSKYKVSNTIKKIKELEDKKLALIEEKEELVSQEKYEQAIGLRGDERKLDEEIRFFQNKLLDENKEFRVDIRPSDIMETVAKISNIPVEKIASEKNHKITNIQKILTSRIIGQQEAIEKLTKVLLRSQSGISNPDRPLGSFLLLGPTGVGKTLLAKVLAQEFFGNPKSLVRIDMSEFMERHSVASLIGSPAGYVGYGEGGNLTEKIRRNPYSVVLFDEIEKAHPDVFNLFLQILEDGALTDAEGTLVSFKNTIIIMTSNTGTDTHSAALDFGFSLDKTAPRKQSDRKDAILRELEARMAPEILNRLDHILIFNNLGEKEIQKIAELELTTLKKRLRQRGITLLIAKDLAKFIAKESHAQKQGARLVRRNVQEMVENKIAELIIAEKVKNNQIEIKIKRGEIIAK